MIFISESGGDAPDDIPEAEAKPEGEEPNEVPDEPSENEGSDEEPYDPFKEYEPNEDPDEESYDPFKEYEPNEDPDEEPYDPFKEYEPNEDPDEEPYDPFKEYEPNEDPDEEPYDPFKEYEPDEDPDEEPYDPFKEYEPDEDPDKPPEEINNPSKSGTITVAVPEQPEQQPEHAPDQEPEGDPEQDPEEKPEEVELVDPEGEPIPPVESPDVMNIRRTLEEGGYEPEYEPEQEPENKPENQPEHEPLNEPETEPESQPEQEPEKEWELINPETGEPVLHQPDLEFIPLEDYIEQLHEQQESSGEVPDIEPEQEPEIIPEQESEVTPEQESEVIPEQESEVIPEQESEVIPEQQQRRAQKKTRIKAKKLELITDPKELGEYKHYEYQHIIKKYDPIYSQKQIRKPQKKPVKKPKQVQKKKPVKVKKLEPITDQKELGEYKHYEYNHTLKTNYSQRQAQKKPEKSEKKSKNIQKPVQKKKPKKVKKLEPITDQKELGEYKHYEYSHTLKKPSKQEQAPKKSEKSEKKSEASQKTEKKSKPEEIKELELIVDPIETEKSEESHESKTDFSSEQTQRVAKNTSEKQEVVKSSEVSKEKVNEVIEQELQTQRQIQQKIKAKKQEKLKTKQKVELVSREQLELQERYHQETGKNPIYAKKPTKGFKEWLEKQKQLALKKSETAKKSESREKWEQLLEKWINEANEKEVSKEIKEELLKIIRKYRNCRAIYWRIVQILKKNDLSKKETEEIESLLKKLEDMTETEIEIFKNLRAFKAFYNENISWYKNQILNQRKKFIQHLAQKLTNLKKNEKTQKVIKKNWKEVLKENLYKNTTLTLSEKSIIHKIIQEEKSNEIERKKIIAILSKLPTEEMISLLGEDYKIHTQNYIRWGWDYDQGVKRLMLTKYFRKQKILDGKEVSYSVNQFFRDLKREIRRITGQKITYRSLSKNFLGMKSKWHVNDKILNSKGDNSNVLAWNLIKLYEKRLKEKFGSDFNQLEKFFNKLRTHKRYLIKKVLDFNKDYFKSLNTKAKAYFYGWLLADGHLDKKGKRLMCEINVKDAEILKRFIKVLNFNPKKVNFKRTEKNEKYFMSMVLEISDENFIKHLMNLGFIPGKKSKKIRFPFSIAKNLELALACLLGFFDGDGSHGRMFPKSLPKDERKFLRPFITSISIDFLNDVKSIFNIRYDISGSRRLSIGTFLFLKMLDNYKPSLDRKRYDGYLSSEELIKLRTDNLRNSWLDAWRWFKLSKKELTLLWEKGWSDKRIADYHKDTYGITITERTVKHWRLEWNLFHTDPKFKVAAKVNLIKELLPLEEWTLEKIYTKLLGYTYNSSNSKHHFRFRKRLKEWFADDPLIQGSFDIVERIKEVYG